MEDIIMGQIKYTEDVGHLEGVSENAMVNLDSTILIMIRDLLKEFTSCADSIPCAFYYTDLGCETSEDVDNYDMDKAEEAWHAKINALSDKFDEVLNLSCGDPDKWEEYGKKRREAFAELSDILPHLWE